MELQLICRQSKILNAPTQADERRKVLVAVSCMIYFDPTGRLFLGRTYLPDGLQAETQIYQPVPRGFLKETSITRRSDYWNKQLRQGPHTTGRRRGSFEGTRFDRFLERLTVCAMCERSLEFRLPIG